MRKFNTVQGSVYFSSKTFAKNPNGWNDSLQNHYYRYPALVPAMPWIDNSIPAEPLFEKQKDGTLKIVYKGEEKIKGFGILVLSAPDAEVKFINAQLVKILIAEKSAVLDLSTIPEAKGKRTFIVTIDKANNVSPMRELK